MFFKSYFLLPSNKDADYLEIITDIGMIVLIKIFFHKIMGHGKLAYLNFTL